VVDYFYFVPYFVVFEKWNEMPRVDVATLRDSLLEMRKMTKKEMTIFLDKLQLNFHTNLSPVVNIFFFDFFSFQIFREAWEIFKIIVCQIYYLPVDIWNTSNIKRSMVKPIKALEAIGYDVYYFNVYSLHPN